MNPSNFTMMQFNSVLKKSEAETIATNVMTILARNGDKWRKLTWEEYAEERTKDGHFAPWIERSYFDQVLPFTTSEATARTFSKTWKNV